MTELALKDGVTAAEEKHSLLQFALERKHVAEGFCKSAYVYHHRERQSSFDGLLTRLQDPAVCEADLKGVTLQELYNYRQFLLTLREKQRRPHFSLIQWLFVSNFEVLHGALAVLSSLYEPRLPAGGGASEKGDKGVSNDSV